MLAKVYPPVVEQQTDVQWEEVQDQHDKQMQNAQQVEVEESGEIKTKNESHPVAKDSEGTQIMHSEAMGILCDSETMKDSTEYSQPEDKVNRTQDKQSDELFSDNDDIKMFEPDNSDDEEGEEELKQFQEYYSHGEHDDKGVAQNEDMEKSEEGKPEEVDKQHVGEDEDPKKFADEQHSEIVREHDVNDVLMWMLRSKLHKLFRLVLKRIAQ